MPQLLLNGNAVDVPAGTTVAAALNMASDGTSRTSVTGRRRAPFCGMGICHECRVMIGDRRRLACQTVCVEGMQVRTDV